MRVVLCDDHLLFAESFAAMLTSLGHEVVGILPFPLPGRAAERETAALMAAEADVCVIDPGAADLVELREDLHTLDGGVSGSQPREIGKADRTRHYINARRHLSGQADTQVIDATLDYSLPREEACRFIVLTAEEHRSAESLRSLLEAEIRGIISKRRSAAEIVEAGTARTRPYSTELLTQRELEVLQWLAHGAATGEMAAAMGISAATVRSHIKAAMSKLEVSSRLQAAARAISLGLVDPPAAA
jgi:two-component system nitrate/nitrite response regulator NarL